VDVTWSEAGSDVKIVTPAGREMKRRAARKLLGVQGHRAGPARA
jgi:hypothetical protein